MRHDLWMRRLSWLGSVLLVLTSGLLARAQDAALEPRIAAEESSSYWLGLICDPADATLRSQLKLKDAGLVVREVVPDAPAAKAGIRERDVLLAAGDTTLNEVRHLVEAVDESEGKELALQILREGEKSTVQVTPVKRPDRSKMPPDVRRWLERRGGPDGPWAWRDVRPGVVTKYLELQRRPHKLPKDMSVTIHKEGEQPAKITVKQGDKSWEVSEDKLSDLPEEVRKHVQPMLRPGAVFTPMPGFDPDMMEKMREGAPFPVPGVPGGDAQRRLEKRVDELNKQIEQLRKSIEEMSKDKAK